MELRIRFEDGGVTITQDFDAKEKKQGRREVAASEARSGEKRRVELEETAPESVLQAQRSAIAEKRVAKGEQPGDGGGPPQPPPDPGGGPPQPPPDPGGNGPMAGGITIVIGSLIVTCDQQFHPFGNGDEQLRFARFAR